MNLLRLSDVREPVARVLNVCTTDAKVRTYANEAHRRLVPKGKWVGTVQGYRICITTDACLVWPRQIETIEAWALCNSPGTVRNRWYEFAGNGPGLLKESSGWYRTLIDKDPVVAFNEIGVDNLTKKIQVVSDYAEVAGLRILLQGYDQNSQWITSVDGGTRINGEYVAISTTPALTTNYFTKLVRVIKPVTAGPVRLNEWDDTSGLVTQSLAYYENDETLPLYRRSFLPGMSVTGGCGGCGCSDDNDDDCDNTKTVNVVAKLRHIDVINDNDFFLLGNLSAIKLGVQAILKEERNLLVEARAYWADATKELDDELSSYEGDGAIPVLKTEDRETWGAGISNVVGNGLWGTWN